MFITYTHMKFLIMIIQWSFIPPMIHKVSVCFSSYHNGKPTARATRKKLLGLHGYNQQWLSCVIIQLIWLLSLWTSTLITFLQTEPGHRSMYSKFYDHRALMHTLIVCACLVQSIPPHRSKVQRGGPIGTTLSWVVVAVFFFPTNMWA